MDVLTAAAGRADVPVWIGPFFFVVAMGWGFGHWRFRTGWHLRDGYYDRRPIAEFTVITLGYMSLPAMLGSVCFGVLGLLLAFAPASPGWVYGYCVVAVALLLLGASVWTAKEYFKPTARRTPGWLR